MRSTWRRASTSGGLRRWERSAWSCHLLLKAVDDRAQGRGEPLALGVGQRGRERLEAGEAALVEPRERRIPRGGVAQALHPAVVRVLAAVHEAALDERVDCAAGAGQGQPKTLSELLDRQLGM